MARWLTCASNVALSDLGVERNPQSRAIDTRSGAASSRLRENEASLEAAATAYDRGNEGQAATNLPHDAINNGEPETAAGADR